MKLPSTSILLTSILATICVAKSAKPVKTAKTAKTATSVPGAVYWYAGDTKADSKLLSQCQTFFKKHKIGNKCPAQVMSCPYKGLAHYSPGLCEAYESDEPTWRITYNTAGKMVACDRLCHLGLENTGPSGTAEGFVKGWTWGDVDPIMNSAWAIGKIDQLYQYKPVKKAKASKFSDFSAFIVPFHPTRNMTSPEQIPEVGAQVCRPAFDAAGTNLKPDSLIKVACNVKAKAGAKCICFDRERDDMWDIPGDYKVASFDGKSKFTALYKGKPKHFENGFKTMLSEIGFQSSLHFPKSKKT